MSGRKSFEPDEEVFVVLQEYLDADTPAEAYEMAGKFMSKFFKYVFEEGDLDPPTVATEPSDEALKALELAVRKGVHQGIEDAEPVNADIRDWSVE